MTEVGNANLEQAWSKICLQCDRPRSYHCQPRSNRSLRRGAPR